MWSRRGELSLLLCLPPSSVVLWAAPVAAEAGTKERMHCSVLERNMVGGANSGTGAARCERRAAEAEGGSAQGARLCNGWTTEAEPAIPPHTKL